MNWYFWLGTSALILIVFVAIMLNVSLRRYKKKRFMTPIKYLFVGVFVSSFFFFYPLHYYNIDNSMNGSPVLSAVFLALQHAMRLFTLEGDYHEFLLSTIREIDGFPSAPYILLGAILYVLAPMLTFTFLMSLFKNIWAYFRYFLLPITEVHVFSELNSKSFALAQSIIAHKHNTRMERLFAKVAILRYLRDGAKQITAKAAERLRKKAASDKERAEKARQNAHLLDQACAALSYQTKQLLQDPVLGTQDQYARLRDCCALVDAQVKQKAEQLPAEEVPNAQINAMLKRAEALENMLKSAPSGQIPGEYQKKLCAFVQAALDASEKQEDFAAQYTALAEVKEFKAQKLAGCVDSFFKHRSHYLRTLSGVGIVFTDVVDKDDEAHNDLIEYAKEMGAILFSKDLQSISFTTGLFRAFRKQLNFYLICENESEKLRHATEIMEAYPYRDVTLYVFSESTNSKMLLGARDQMYPKVVRVHDHQSLIYRNLDMHGIRMFQNAKENCYDASIDCATITAVVVGLGRYGKEMLKALTWYSQVPGFRIKIHGFDIGTQMADQLLADCPGLEIVEFDRSAVAEDQAAANTASRYEPRYQIILHSGVDVHTQTFAQEFSAIKQVSFVFVCLGSDEINIQTSAKIREILEKTNVSHQVDIEAVVYDSNLCQKMGYRWDAQQNDGQTNGCVNHKEQEYRIHMIGNTDEFYSVETMLNSELTEQGLQMHRSYISNHLAKPTYENVRTKSGKKPTGFFDRQTLLKKKLDEYDQENAAFWRYEYNYRSSLARAMFIKLIGRLEQQGLTNVPGWTLPPEQRDDAQDLECSRVEHVRWMLYMMTEGYVYGQTRNDLAKQHDLLIPAIQRYPDIEADKKD